MYDVILVLTFKEEHMSSFVGDNPFKITDQLGNGLEREREREREREEREREREMK